MEKEIDFVPDTKKQKILKTLAIIGIFFVVPLGLGLGLAFGFQNQYFCETIFAIFGAVCMLIGLFQDHARDSKNVKKNHTLVEDKKDPAYKEYKYYQRMFLIVGAFTLLCSLFSFLIAKYCFSM